MEIACKIFERFYSARFNKRYCFFQLNNIEESDSYIKRVTESEIKEDGTSDFHKFVIKKYPSNKKQLKNWLVDIKKYKKVITFKKVDYINKNGYRVRGLELILSSDDESGTWANGKVYESVFVSNNNIDCPINVGDEVELLYNKYGKISKVNKL